MDKNNFNPHDSLFQYQMMIEKGVIIEHHMNKLLEQGKAYCYETKVTVIPDLGLVLNGVKQTDQDCYLRFEDIRDEKYLKLQLYDALMYQFANSFIKQFIDSKKDGE